MSIEYLRFKFVHFFFKRILANLKELNKLRELHSRFPTATIENNVQVKNPRNLKLGRHVIIQCNTVLHCGGMKWCRYRGGIEIGADSCISPACVFYGTGAKIHIGRNFDCGPGVKIFASRSRYELRTEHPQANEHVFDDVIIGDNVICYANVIISSGVKIGEGAVIAAGSVVLHDIEPYAVVAGVPARKIKTRPIQ